jgi:hypothetical protein
MATIPQVNRGDLITAELFDQLITAYNSLDARVTVLEGHGPGGPNQVVITSLEPPSGAVRVGQDLTIRGQNFGHSAGRLKVFIDDLPIDNFNRPGTNDETIIITIPPEAGTPPPPLAGRAAQLTVSNSITTAQRTITLMPTAIVVGTVPLTLKSTDPIPAAGSDFTMQMHLESQLSRVAVAQIGATVTGIAATPQILTPGLAPRDTQVQLDPAQTLDFAVQIAIPGGIGAVPFTVAVTATVEGSQRGLQSSPFTVGTPVEQPDPTIGLPMPTTATISPAGAGSFASGVLHLTAAGATGSLAFAARLTVAGDYTSVSALESGSGWTPTLIDNAAFTIGNPDLTAGFATRIVRLRIAVAPGGATPGFVRLRVRRTGALGNGTSQIVTVTPT